MTRHMVNEYWCGCGARLRILDLVLLSWLARQSRAPISIPTAGEVLTNIEARQMVLWRTKDLRNWDKERSWRQQRRWRRQRQKGAQREEKACVSQEGPQRKRKSTLHRKQLFLPARKTAVAAVTTILKRGLIKPLRTFGIGFPLRCFYEHVGFAHKGNSLTDTRPWKYLKRNLEILQDSFLEGGGRVTWLARWTVSQIHWI